MNKVLLVLLGIALSATGCGFFGGGGTGHHGELTSVLDRPEWDQYQPMSMVQIPAGSFHMGQNDQDVPYSQIAHQKQITISSFYMDDMEINNNKYRQFLYGPTDNERKGSKVVYEALLDTIDPTMIDVVVPDTAVWVRDFAYSYNEPLLENYFWHPAFDDYPVVGVNWYAAAEFCRWRTALLNQYREEKKLPAMPRFRLPTEAEWEYAARGGYEHKLYPWQGPYLRNSKGCFLANFKPGRGDYIADNFEYTAPIDAYWPNDYGLFNMPGNVAEWCEDDFAPSAFTYNHDLNPVYKDKSIPPADRLPNSGRQPGIKKVIRGGSWKDIGYFLSCGARTYEYADTTKAFIGFRCVMTVIGRSGASGG